MGLENTVRDIRDALKARLETIKADLGIKEVFQMHPDLPVERLPHCALDLESLDCIRLTSHTKQLQLVFIIGYYASDINHTRLETTLLQAADSIMKTLEEDPSLGGKVASIDWPISARKVVQPMVGEGKFLHGVEIRVKYLTGPLTI